jgi:hypothetical protein
MGQPATVTHLHDLVRSQGEPRWTAVVDGALALGMVAWVVVLSVTDPGATLRVVVPLVLAAVVVVRVMLLVEHVQRFRELGLDQAPPPAPARHADRAQAA